MNKHLKSFLTLAICLTGINSFAQHNPPQRIPPHRNGGSIIEDIIKDAIEAKEANKHIETYYNINSPVGGGAALDESWSRQPIETLLDGRYCATLPRISDEHMPPRPTKENPDPFKDNTKSILHSASTHHGHGAGPANASQEREALAIELIGYSSKVPKDLLEPIRRTIEASALARERHYVLDAQTVLGKAYDGEAVYYDGESGHFHFTPRMQALYCKGVRYVISAFVSQYFTHSYFSSSTAKYPTYESAITVHLTCYDLDRQEILETQIHTLQGSGSSQVKADESAISSLKWKVPGMIDNNFPVTINITAIGEPDNKGKYHDCTTDYGSNFGAHDGDNFYVYLMDAEGRGTRLGRIKVNMVIDGNKSVCKIASGQEKIATAVKQNANLLVYSLDQYLK